MSSCGRKSACGKRLMPSRLCERRRRRSFYAQPSSWSRNVGSTAWHVHRRHVVSVRRPAGQHSRHVWASKGVQVCRKTVETRSYILPVFLNVYLIVVWPQFKIDNNNNQKIIICGYHGVGYPRVIHVYKYIYIIIILVCSTTVHTILAT